MPQCSICAHEARDVIDSALVSGASVRDVARQFTASRSAVHRHRTEHLSQALVAVAAERHQKTFEEVMTIEARLETRIRDLDQKMATLKPGASEWIRAAAEVRKHLETIARLRGELAHERAPVAVVNLHASPDWLEVRTTILRALEPFPEARQAVVAALTGSGSAPAAPFVIEGSVVGDA